MPATWTAYRGLRATPRPEGALLVRLSYFGDRSLPPGRLLTEGLDISPQLPPVLALGLGQLGQGLRAAHAVEVGAAQPIFWSASRCRSRYTTRGVRSSFPRSRSHDCDCRSHLRERR